MRSLSFLPVAVGVLTIALAGCGPAGSGALGPAPSGTGTSLASGPPAAPSGPASPPGPTSSARSRLVGLQVWLARGGRLFETRRQVTATASIGAAAMRELLAGPSRPESAAGLTTAVPGGTALLGLTIKAGTATADLSESFTASASPALVRLRLAQVVYTLTQFPTVTAVRFEVGGAPVRSIAGVATPSPADRASYASSLPAITVASPVIGQQVTSPVTVSGSADVFEAVVSIRILDASGAEIARTFTNATCGTGCRGDYSAGVQFTVHSAQAGTIEAFEVSARSGQPVNVQRIPVELLP